MSGIITLQDLESSLGLGDGPKIDSIAKIFGSPTLAGRVGSTESRSMMILRGSWYAVQSTVDPAWEAVGQRLRKKAESESADYVRIHEDRGNYIPVDSNANKTSVQNFLRFRRWHLAHARTLSVFSHSGAPETR